MRGKTKPMLEVKSTEVESIIKNTQRRELLGSRELKEVAYGFKLSSKLDEDQAIRLLSALGESRYAGQTEVYTINETEYGNEFETELRWPQQDTDWVDSIKIRGSEHSPVADLGVHFWRSADEINDIPQKSEQEARGIYQKLEQLLLEKL